MTKPTQSDVTRILVAGKSGDTDHDTAADQIFELVYDELRRLAARIMQAERADHTLQPTALVHEAYCNLVDRTKIEWQSRAHFFGIAARAMRQILVDHARRKGRAKRGGDWARTTFADELAVTHGSEIDLLEFNGLLDRLADLHGRMARVVELRIFVGLKAKEVAHVLGVSERTVYDDWRVAKMWLRREPSGDEASQSAG
jgi:RNA polymerase sigma factor (TIGR02999 family)